MKTSKSTKWDASTGFHVPYDKHNVLSTEMLGGEMCGAMRVQRALAMQAHIAPRACHASSCCRARLPCQLILVAHCAHFRYYAAPVLHHYAVAVVRSVVAHVLARATLSHSPPFSRCAQLASTFPLALLSLGEVRQCIRILRLFCRLHHADISLITTAQNLLCVPAMARTSTSTTTTRAWPCSNQARISTYLCSAKAFFSACC
jgi:hypothetical protein